MTDPSIHHGLTSAEATALQEQYGKNELSPQKNPVF